MISPDAGTSMRDHRAAAPPSLPADFTIDGPLGKVVVAGRLGRIQQRVDEARVVVQTVARLGSRRRSSC